MDISKLALGGGLLFALTMIHFIADWIFQSNKTAMAKHNNSKVRLEHCLIYSIAFIPIMFVLKLQLWEIYTGTAILFFSHFIEDTYLPVLWWAKYIRKPPEMKLGRYRAVKDDIMVDYPTNDQEAFVDFVNTPLGRILAIVVDQIVHIIFLIPIVWMALN